MYLIKCGVFAFIRLQSVYLGIILDLSTTEANMKRTAPRHLSKNVSAINGQTNFFTGQEKAIINILSVAVIIAAAKFITTLTGA